MSIRMVAAELYRVMQEIEKLEKKLEGLDLQSPEWEDCENNLRKVRAERRRLRNVLEGAKQT